MCTMYWNLKAWFNCPKCGDESDVELQTHWLGCAGSCVNHYGLGERVEELKGIPEAVLDGENDRFAGICGVCGARIGFGARIVDEAVVEVWPIAFREAGSAPSPRGPHRR